ncbi:hypothetical protein F5X98DRAFT_359526 [Xylaria grammica]|nr:hypothetical protein F5X98DRAFT_359526 [Xylaria grammica]
MGKIFYAVWRAPTSILGSLLIGAILSVGHHLYHASLDGTFSEGDRIIAGYHISNQTFTTAIGTGFAFIVRAFLTFAVSGAYVQVFWKAATHSRKDNTLEEIDAMFSILSNLFAFCWSSVWWKYPLLFLIALVAWLLPIAFTIPPASLSVAVAPFITSALVTVPNFDFASLRYVAGVPKTNKNTQYGYDSPSPVVLDIANAVAKAGEILPITPPVANSSWKLEFYGPSLACHPLINQTIRLETESHIAGYLLERQYYSPIPDTYLAWSSSRGDAAAHPWSHLSNGFFPGPVSYSINVAVLPDFSDPSIARDWKKLATPLQPLGPGNITLLQCDLQNSSYNAAFNYQSGRQSITVEVNQTKLIDPLNWYDRSDVFPNLFNKGPLIINPMFLRLLSYTAITDAFYQIINGYINIPDDSPASIETGITSTVLLDTPELRYLSPLKVAPARDTLQADLLNRDATKGQSLFNLQNATKLEQPLQTALEELFQNITISLLSSELLRPNMTSEFAPPMPTVTSTVYKAVYQYSSRQLWIAYGVAIAASTLASLFGLLAVAFNYANYSSDFSSVYRTAHGSKLSVKMREEDMSATDPLPEYLAKAALYIANPKSAGQLVPEHESTATVEITPNSSHESSTQRPSETGEGGGTNLRLPTTPTSRARRLSIRRVSSDPAISPPGYFDAVS